MIKKRKILSLVLVFAMAFTSITLPTNTKAKGSTRTAPESTAISKKEVKAIAKEVIETDDYVEGELLVVLKKEYSSMKAEFKASDFPEVNAVKVENLTYCSNPDSELISENFKTILSVTLKHRTDEEMLKAIDKLMERKDIESVSLNNDAQIQSTQTVPPSDTMYNNKYAWELKKIDILGAWSKTTGSPTVRVGIIDSGIEYTHDELASNMWKNSGEIPGDGIDNDGNGYIDDIYGWNFYDNNSNVMDTDGHGTFCAGIVAADINHKDVVGVAPNVKLVALKVGNDSFSSKAVVKAITYAANTGIEILNFSARGDVRNPAEDEALHNYKGLFVVAAGNNGTNNDVIPTYPKTDEFTNVMKVGASGSAGGLAGFSNYGALDVTLTAPSGAYSTEINNTYGGDMGTSASAPFVAGVAALIKSQYPSLSTENIIFCIKEGVDKSEYLNGKVETGGCLNANKAMEAARMLSIGTAVKYSKDVYNYADFKEAMENDYYSTVYILRDIKLEGEIRITRNYKRFIGGSKLIGNGQRHFIIDTTDSVYLDLGGVIYENGGIQNRSLDFHLEGSGAVIKDSNWVLGGAIYNTGNMIVKGVRIENCNATSGGGICNTGTMTLIDTTIFNNHAVIGGAIHTTGPMTISGGVFKSNTASNNGGAIYGDSYSDIIIKNTPAISYNTAEALGGGIFTYGKLRTETPDGLKVGNNSAKNGGGIYGATGADIHLEGKSPGGPSVAIENNQASENGGGVYLNTGASLYLNNTFLAVNKAQGVGAAMLIKGTYTRGSFVQVIGNIPDGIVYQ